MFDTDLAPDLCRQQEEQHEFESFLENLRKAKDKAEFDQFMSELRSFKPADERAPVTWTAALSPRHTMTTARRRNPRAV